ncbi:hypothetical protein MUK42_37648 [Musa troglodytarum]|uniref:Uncharacterized protein n=1 Tax=Musa troglodytarum TaxID=320322 RepID=A0A9E7EBY0_9LILI|nr:hypothetical protein MUK42_37648 [Musa troglodytarum]
MFAWKDAIFCFYLNRFLVVSAISEPIKHCKVKQELYIFKLKNHRGSTQSCNF